MSKRKSEYFKNDHQAHGLSRKLPTGAVCVRYDCSDTTLRRWVRDPRLDFPQPFQITEGGVNFYDEAQLDAYDARRAAQAPELYARASARRKAEAAARKLGKVNEAALTAAPDTDATDITAVPVERRMSVPQRPPLRRS